MSNYELSASKLSAKPITFSKLFCIERLPMGRRRIRSGRLSKKAPLVPLDLTEMFERTL